MDILEVLHRLEKVCENIVAFVIKLPCVRLRGIPTNN